MTSRTKTSLGLALLLAAPLCAQTSPTLSYWFDNLPHTTIPIANGGNSIEIDASSIPAGIHTFSSFVSGGNGISSTKSALFIKPFTLMPEADLKGLVIIDGKPLDAIPVNATANGASFIYDASQLAPGVHSLTSAIASSKGDITSYAEALFMRVPTEAELTSMKAYYIIDDDETSINYISPTSNASAYKIDIDVAALSTGIHTITMFLASPYGFSTTPMKSFFIKIPNGGMGVKSYNYWIDNDIAGRATQTFDKANANFSLVTLIEVPVAPFKSSNFEMKMENGTPVIYGIHSLNFLCYDSDYRTTLASRDFIESRRPVRVDDVEKLTLKKASVKTPKITDNDIKWYSITMLTGDSITVKTNAASMIDIFTPNGERCYRATGASSTVANGFHALADGDYMIAIHDIAGQNKSATFTYQHIDKYDIIQFTPRKTAAADIFVLNITGNGLEHLTDVTLTGDGESFSSTRIINQGQGSGLIQFNLQDAPNGSYTLIANYNDGIEEGQVIMEDALTVVDARPGEITTKAARSVFGTTLNDVRITICNTGNVPYWGVPLCIAAEADGNNPIKLNFKDFIPNMPGDSINDWEFVMTDNLLDIGRRGIYIPLMIPYLGPNETKEYTIVYQMPLQVHIPTYVWAGRPWSDEFKELIQLAKEEKPFPIKNQNYISATTMLLCLAVAELDDDSGTNAHRAISKAPGHHTDYSGIHEAVELAENVGDRLGVNTRPLHNADRVAALSVGLGNSYGGIINAGRIHNLDAYGVDLRDSNFSSLANYRSDLVASLPDPVRIIDDSFGGRTARLLRQLFGLNGHGGCAETADPMPRRHDIVQMTSCDPNDITGYQDPSGGRHVGIGVNTMPYTIEFENDPALANAPAHVIKVTDKLDPTVFNLASLSVKEIEIGSKTFKPDNGSSDFIATIDMRPEINAIAEISFTIDLSDGNAEWVFRTLDPMTMEPATEMAQGILPVNTSGEGCGKILFDVNLNDDLTSGTEFVNMATIYFDENEPITTPIWTNVTDFIRPQARITSARISDDGNLSFDVESTDNGAGVWNYDLYFRQSGSSEWQLLTSGVPTDCVEYHPNSELQGNFCVVATDKAGNRQLETPMNTLMGDADGNGQIDATDVIVIQNYFLGKDTQINRIASDLNIDYNIDAQDALETTNIFLNSDLTRSKHIRTRKNKKHAK